MPLYIGSAGLNEFQQLLDRAPTDQCLGAALAAVDKHLAASRYQLALGHRVTIDWEDITKRVQNDALQGVIETASLEPNEVSEVSCRACGHCALIGLNPPTTAFRYGVAEGQQPCHVMYQLSREFLTQALTPAPPPVFAEQVIPLTGSR